MSSSCSLPRSVWFLCPSPASEVHYSPLPTCLYLQNSAPPAMLGLTEASFGLLHLRWSCPSLASRASSIRWCGAHCRNQNRVCTTSSFSWATCLHKRMDTFLISKKKPLQHPCQLRTWMRWKSRLSWLTLYHTYRSCASDPLIHCCCFNPSILTFVSFSNWVSSIQPSSCNFVANFLT